MRLRTSLAVVLLATGCTTTHTIPKAQLAQLHGWRDDGNTVLEDVGAALRGERKDVRRLIDSSGRAHKFDRDTPLVFFHPDGSEQAGTYMQVDVTSEEFLGVPTDYPGERVVVPLNQVQAAGIRRFSLGNTLLLTGGIAAGLFVGLVSFGLATGGGGGGGGGDD